MDKTQIKNSLSGNVFKASEQVPIEIKPVIGRQWITNGVNNELYDLYRNAYDDSPTNSSIINAFTNYIFGNGLIDKNGQNIDKYISQEDVLLMVQDLKIYGGFTYQVIRNKLKQPFKIKYLPVFKIGLNYEPNTLEINGFWYSWDWKNRFRYKPTFFQKYEGYYKNADIEIGMVKRPHSEPFFPIPDYLSCLAWCKVEAELANAGKNHLRNSMSSMTIINYNNGRIHDENVAKEQADIVRKKAVGTDNQGGVIVSFNEGAEEAVVVDQLHPPELNQQNVFFSEEAERKIIVGHSAPPILFAGSNSGSGFSSNADEIAVATKGLYRRHINPMRKIFLRGLQEVFNEIDNTILLDFEDFEEETDITTADGGVVSDLNTQTLEAQANLKGSVGGVQSLLEIQASYSQGLTTYESAINMLDIIFGYDRNQAIRLLGQPKKEVI